MSGVSARLRACPLWPGLAPPGRDPSRFALRSVDGGFEDVREVLSGRCSRSTNSTNSGFVSPSSSSRFTGRMNHRQAALARGWVDTMEAAHGSDRNLMEFFETAQGVLRAVADHRNAMVHPDQTKWITITDYELEAHGSIVAPT